MNKKICVSVAEKSVEGCIKALEGLTFAEVRLDALEKNPSAAQVKEIFSKPIKIIATCREGKFSQHEREEILVCAIESKAAFVDIEVGAKKEMHGKIVRKAKEAGCKIIVSHHDNEKTPSREELEAIVARCFEAGADVAKIACKVNENADNARLLGLLGSGRKMVVVGMGSRGKITRIAAPLLGSEFTFASIGRGKETADGQMEKEKMEKALKGVENATN